MADYSPTIIAASLNDNELKSAIDKLVKYVDDGALKMAESFNAGVQLMRESLQSLGKANIANNILSQARAHSEVTKELEKQANGYDRVERARSRATNKKHDYVQLDSDVDKQWSYIIDMNKDVDAQLQHMIEHEQKLIQEKEREAQVTREIQQTHQATIARGGVSGESLGWGDVNTAGARAREWARGAKEVNYLRQQVASLLEIEEREVRVANTTTSSYAQLNQYLKQLQHSYQRLGADRIAKGEGTDIVNEIQRIQRAMAQLNAQMSRPTSLNAALGLEQKTLDDVAYKIQMLQRYRSGLDMQGQAGEISMVNSKINELNKLQNQLINSNKGLLDSNNALTRSWNYMKNRLAFYFTVGASTAFIRNLIDVRSQYEMNERALGILVNSAERGTQIFSELSQMALVSPYTLIELSTAAKQLTAYDVAAKDVVDTTRRLADMAAAVGIPIERLTYALGQIKAYGYLNARDARMFANAGIPLVKQLAEYYTELEGRLVSTADIYDRIKKKSIGYEEVTSVIAKMTDEGGKFYDFQAKMADTLKVQLANLTLAWNNMLNAMGEDSQGIIVGSIKSLKQVFLHWKDIEHVVNELVVAFAAYKVYQIVTTRLMGATTHSLDAQVLSMKRNNAAMLEKQALTRKLTVDEAKLIATQRQITALDYQNALGAKQLTKQKAMLLLALNQNNVALKAAMVNMGLLTTREAQSITVGKALSVVFKSMWISIRNVALAMKSFMASMLPLLLIGVGYELYHAWDSYGEHVKEVNKQTAEHAKEAFDNIKQYLESDVTMALRDRLSRGVGVESEALGQKAWDEMREKIELSSSASNSFIAKLMQIDDINERLSTGFGYLDELQRVTGVMQTLGDDAIKVSSTVLGGLGGEGLKDDLEDFIKYYEKYISLSEQLRQGYVGEEAFNDQKKALEEFRSEVEKTIESIYNISKNEGFNTDEQREFLERAISETAQAEQMGIKETRIYRMKAEEEYYRFSREKLLQEQDMAIKLGDVATKNRIARELNALDEQFGSQRAMQEVFFTWLAEKQDHVVKNMLRGKTQEEIKQGEWLTDANAKWVDEMARNFSKEYGVSFNDLHNLVLQANTWSINIPVFFQTIGQPLSDIQRDYEARTGRKFSDNALIKDAKTQGEVIDILKKKQKEVANDIEIAQKAGGEYWENNKKRLNEENDALVEQIHSYNALTDAEEKAEKKSAKGSKKDHLGDALTKELQLITDIQKLYKEYTKAGIDSETAKNAAAKEYQKTLEQTNATLSKFGVQGLTGEKLATMDLRQMRDYYQSILDKVQSSPKAVEALEKAIKNLNVEITKEGQKTIIDSLNNELSKVKDEYELAIDLDANPELGGVFADMMGLSKEELEKLPRDFEGVVRKLQNVVDKELGMGAFDVRSNLNKDVFDEWVKSNKYAQDSDLVAKLKAITDYANKVRQDETKKQIDDWNKLLEKYAEYEYKRNQIMQEAERERETARKKGAGSDIINAIDLRERRELAKLDFEQFQNTPTWIAATGDLAGMTSSAIGMLISKLEQYKKSAKNLDPKQIKQINSALKKLYSEQRKGNPFAAIANAIDEAKERFNDYQLQIDEAGERIDVLNEKLQTEAGLTEAEKNELADLVGKIKEWREEQEKVGKVSATAIVEGIQQMLSSINQVIGGISEMFAAFGNTEVSENIQKVTQVLDKAASFAAMGAQVGGTWGAVIGGVVGGLMGAVTAFADEISGNAKITRQIEESEREVKRLSNAYEELSWQAENAYGVIVSGLQHATVENKKLQLAEAERQLELEKSRSKKRYDEDRVLELQGQVDSLRREIKDATSDIVNDLLGISSAGDEITNLVQVMIDAFRNGEDAMEAFGKEWDKMIDNMILKLIVSEYMKRSWDNIMKTIEDKQKEFLEKGNSQKASAEAEIERLQTANGYDLAKAYILKHYKETQGDLYGLDKSYFSMDIYNRDQLARAAGFANAEALRKYLIQQQQGIVEGSNAQLERASQDYTEWTLDYMMHEGRDMMMSAAEGLKQGIDQYYDFGELAEGQKLSNLQQGIQGITEDTASALEAYMNSVSQQVYLHSDLLTQIRDAVVGFDLDVQLGVQSQMLLQLQNNYIVIQSMQSLMENWTTPAGNGIRVEVL